MKKAKPDLFISYFLCPQALEAAKRVHAFVRDADDAIDWIQEKDVVVSSNSYGQDLEGVRALIVKHEGFEVRKVQLGKSSNLVDTDFPHCGKLSHFGMRVLVLKSDTAR